MQSIGKVTPRSAWAAVSLAWSWQAKQLYELALPSVWQVWQRPLAPPWLVGKMWVKVTGFQADVLWHCEHWP